MSDRDPLWYKDAVFYELHVCAFKDGNDDGIGDFIGLTGQLGHLKELGVDCVNDLSTFGHSDVARCLCAAPPPSRFASST